MTDKKFTDEEIIKALECCSEPAGKCCCEECPLHHRDDSCTTALIKKAVELVNRQKAEIEILIRKKESLRDEIYELQSEVERLKEFEYMYNSLLK